MFQKSNRWRGKAGHTAGGWELQLPGSYQELLFLLVLAVLTAPQSSAERFFSSHLLSKGKRPVRSADMAGDTQLSTTRYF